MHPPHPLATPPPTAAFRFACAHLTRRYSAQAAERAARRATAAREDEAAAKAAAESEFARAMRAAVPEQPRTTRAAALKVTSVGGRDTLAPPPPKGRRDLSPSGLPSRQAEAVRERQLSLEKEAAREVARRAARDAKLREAANGLRPALRACDEARAKGARANEDARNGGEAEPSLKTKVQQNRAALDAKVAARRPTLMERLSVTSARDKAKAAALRAVGSTLRDVYGGETGSAGGQEKWLAAALADGLLEADEAEYLKLTQPNLARTANDDGAYAEEY